MKQAKEIATLLATRAEDICRMLLKTGVKASNEWCVGDVMGNVGESLKIHLSGSKAGLWADFATGESGDLLDLWAAVKNISISASMKEASAYLGLKTEQFVGQQHKTFRRPTLNIKETKYRDVHYLTQRGLTSETIAAFMIRQTNTTVVFPFYRGTELIFVKYLQVARADGKKIMSVEKDCEPCLFGWQVIDKNARSITICEGEIDAMTLYQYGYPALSVPLGAGTGKKHEWIEYEFERLAQFDEIFLCFDDDEPGHKAALEVSHRLGQHRCKILSLPAKDPNECLMQGLPVGHIHHYYKEAETVDPHELRSAGYFVEEVIAEFYPPGDKELGNETPWEKLRGKVLFRPNEISIWTGINGHGKSQMLGQILLNMMHAGAKTCVASLELKPKKFLQRLTRQASAMRFPAPGYIRNIHEWYSDKLWLFNLTGNAQHERLIEVFKYAYQRYGVDTFVIDSFMKLDVAEDDYKAQKSVIEQLCDFKNQFDCHIHIVVHPRKGADEHTMPNKLDMKGTGAITDLADNCFTVWRNKNKEKVVQSQRAGVHLSEREQQLLLMPDSILRCDKQRNGEWEGSAGLWFDVDSFQYLEHEAQKPQRIVEYSCLMQHD